MRKRWRVGLCGCAAAVAIEKATPNYPTLGKIDRKDPRFDKLVPKDAQIEVLAAGFKWSEGPLWIKDGGYLLFSDIPRNSVMKWKEGEGVSLLLKPSGYTGVVDYGNEPGSNGLTLDRQGRIHVLRARRSARFAIGERRRQEDARRQLSRQAAQQPQRSGLQIERRSVLHRSALRAAQEV